MAVSTEQLKNNSGATASALNKAYTSRATESQNTINSAMDNSLDAQKQGLLDAYNQNTAKNEENAGNISSNYGVAQATTDAQAFREQTNNNRFADVRDVNRGEGSQQALNQRFGQQRAQATINVQKERALDENNRQRELLATNYQNQIKEALANNDYQRAAALFDDYNNQENWKAKQAQVLASYGNFAGYENLYGSDQASAMKSLWTAQNPLVAYNTGAITAAQYKRMTGEDAPDQQTDASGYNWGNVTWVNGRPVYKTAGDDSPADMDDIAVHDYDGTPRKANASATYTTYKGVPVKYHTQSTK